MRNRAFGTNRKWLPIGLLLVSGSVAAGFLASPAIDHTATAANSTPYRKLQVFTEVLSSIERNYIEPVDEQKLVYGAIRGMINSLDPHSLFMPPDIYQEMKKGSIGEYGGVGLELGMRDRGITVIAPLEGSPAQKAGFQPGDILLSIDGVSTEGMTLLDVVLKIRGNPGTKVQFEVRRKSSPDRVALELIREQLQIVPIEGRLLGGNIFYIRIKNFHQKNTFGLMIEILERLVAEVGGRDRVGGCIIDLRNNPGGLLDQAIKVTDEFLDDGLIVSTEGRDRRDEEKFFAQRGGRLDWPMVILVNRGSASASEIVAGALQDHGRAIILGTRTFGKGSVQTLFDLKDGSGLKLTVARYFTPSHRCIQGQGIDPDIVVEPLDLIDLKARGILPEDDGAREVELAGHLSGVQGSRNPPPAWPEEIQRDNQLRSALDLLRVRHVFESK